MFAAYYDNMFVGMWYGYRRDASADSGFGK